MVTLNASEPLSADLTDAVGTSLTDFLDAAVDRLAGVGAEIDELGELAHAFTAGGKRLRPAFCCWGYLAAAGGTEVPEAVLQVAASLDLLHVSALVHDDVLDGSQTRRGLPAAHVQLAARHAAGGWRGDSDGFGRSGAILLGDLLLAWSVELADTSGAERLAQAQPLLAAVRAEVAAGQYLDVTAQSRTLADVLAAPASVDEQIRRVVEFKTARYTVIRPLQVGAALGGGSAELLELLGRFGSPLGRAFQFRDDVLGVFGDAEVTGKPAGDDLREGKLTVLVANAMARAPRDQAERLAGLLGRPLSPEEVDQARAIIVDSGALAATEAEIADAARAASAVLDERIAAPARTALARLVVLATQRQS